MQSILQLGVGEEGDDAGDTPGLIEGLERPGLQRGIDKSDTVACKLTFGGSDGGIYGEEFQQVISA